jgi:hypothetical protein
MREDQAGRVGQEEYGREEGRQEWKEVSTCYVKGMVLTPSIVVGTMIYWPSCSSCYVANTHRNTSFDLPAVVRDHHKTKVAPSIAVTNTAKDGNRRLIAADLSTSTSPFRF